MDEDEVVSELEAARSVYGDDCTVLLRYPPHLHVHIKPRTAEITSQQFVEAVIGIQAGSKYPDEPPHISVVDCKGLDEQRQAHLINCIQDKACELSSCLMLVALCEEAVEKLTSMNHPDGNCPLCLSPLVEEGGEDEALPFMKLMSCFHCFHCECIIRWWNWLQKQKEGGSTSSSARPKCLKTRTDTKGEVEEDAGNCPVCRKAFHSKDIEHVLNLSGAYSQLSLDDGKSRADEELLQSDSENTRRQKFEAILKLQQENDGLIEPKKHEVLQPGMFLPRPITTPQTEPESETNVVASSNEPDKEPNANVSSTKPNTSERRNSGTRRRGGGRNSRPQNRHWIKRDNGAPN